MDIEFRLARLEADNKALREKIAQLEHLQGRKVLPAPPAEEVVRVTSPAPVSGFVMPSEENLERLSHIVIAQYPQFGDVSGQGFYGSKEEREEDFWRQFKAAFLALGASKRLDQPDHKKYLSYHVSAVEGYLRAIGKSETLRHQPFMCAVLSHGDILHSGIGLHHAGHSIHIGLSQYVGRSAGASWRAVLRTKQLLAPSAGEVFEPFSPIQVVNGIAR
jgi:hypothetical protein